MSVLRSATIRFFCLLLLAVAALPAGAARAGLLYHLGSGHAEAGTNVEIQGLLYNDTGAPLASPVAKELEGQWVDASGHTTPARFHLRTSPDAVNLPPNTFTQMIWTGGVPANASGLLTLRLNGADGELLALRVEGGGSTTLADAGQPDAHLAVSGNSTPSTAAAATATATQATNQSASPAAATPSLSPFETFRNAISPYDPIYFIAGTKDGASARFQVSLKYRLISPTDPQHASFMNNWYLGYTQTTLWDLHSDSIPFVDTTYNPSLFWARESLVETPDKRWSLGLNTGLEHKSNGRSGIDSRSLNDLYIQPELNYRFDTGSTLSFMPRFKHYVRTDPEMDYPGSLGYVDWKLRWAQDDGLVLSALYRQGTGGRNATQLELAWPLKRTFLHMNGYLYTQYFRGYGETLLDYNQKHSPQWRIGIALVP